MKRTMDYIREPKEPIPGAKLVKYSTVHKAAMHEWVSTGLVMSSWLRVPKDRSKSRSSGNRPGYKKRSKGKQ